MVRDGELAPAPKTDYVWMLENELILNEMKKEPEQSTFQTVKSDNMSSNPVKEESSDHTPMEVKEEEAASPRGFKENDEEIKTVMDIEEHNILKESSESASHEKWTRESTLRLIALLEENENLWRLGHPEYKNRVERAASLNTIAALLGMKKDAVEKKIHNLRCQYRNERNKERKKKNGAGSSNPYQSKWEFFGLLQFLYISEEGNEMNLDSLNSSLCEATLTKEDTLTKLPPTSGSSSSLLKRKRKVEYEDILLKKCLKVMEGPVDRHQVFGDYVANELRCLLNDKYEKKLKLAIQRAIIDITEQVLNDEENDSSNLFILPLE